MLRYKGFYLFLAVLFAGELLCGAESTLEKCERLQSEAKGYAAQIEQSPKPLPKIVKKMNALQKDLDQCSTFLKKFEQEIPCQSMAPYVNPADGKYVHTGGRYNTGETPSILKENLSGNDRVKIEQMRFGACLPYWEEHPTVSKCEWLLRKINGLESKEEKEGLDALKKEFGKCEDLIKSFEQEIPCENIFPYVSSDNQYSISQKFYKKGKEPNIPAERLAKEDKGKIEYLRFNACLPYWEEHPTISTCEWLFRKIQRYSYLAENEPTTHPEAKEELAKFQKEFDKCSDVIKSFEEEIPCDAFSPSVGPTGEYSYNAGTRTFKEGKEPKIPEEKLDPRDRKNMEILRFYECVPQWLEEARLAAAERQKQEELEQQRKIQEEKARKDAYFAKCPKGITTTSFDCYQLNKKFVNHGFRGNDFEEWSHERVHGLEMYAAYDPYPKNTQIYDAEGAEERMRITVVNGMVARIIIELTPKDSSPEAVHRNMKKRFPTLKETRGGKIMASSNGNEFEAFNNGGGYSIFYDSTLVETTKAKEAREKLRKEEQNAKDLF